MGFEQSVRARAREREREKERERESLWVRGGVGFGVWASGSWVWDLGCGVEAGHLRCGLEAGLGRDPVRDARHPEALAMAEPWEHFQYEEEGNGPQQDRHLRWAREGEVSTSRAALEATHWQKDSFFSELPSKCYLEEVASVGD